MRRVLVLLLAGVLLIFCTTVLAQTTGDVEGKITDLSGAALPGVTVEAKSSSLQGIRTGVSNRDGVFRFPGVPPGLYSIKAALSGFDPTEETVRVALQPRLEKPDRSRRPAELQRLVRGTPRRLPVYRDGPADASRSPTLPGDRSSRNYDGGVRGDGQTDPGINADFDYPELFHNSYGRLYLDRPHSFRFDGYYSTPFKVWVGLQGYVQSGAPQSRVGYLNGLSFGFPWPAVQLVSRGTEGRMPTIWEASLTLGYPFRVGPVTVTVQAYVFNLFDNQIATSRDDGWSNYPPPDYPASLYDPNQEQNNPEYGKTTGRQEPRSLRASLKISF